MGNLVLGTMRLKDISRRKLKIIASYKDSPINAIIQELVDKEIADWERTHGVIEIPEK